MFVKADVVEQLKGVIKKLEELVNDFELDRAELYASNNPYAIEHRAGPVQPVSLIRDGVPLANLPPVQISVHRHEIKKWYIMICSAKCPTYRKTFVTDVKIGEL